MRSSCLWTLRLALLCGLACGGETASMTGGGATAAWSGGSGVGSGGETAGSSAGGTSGGTSGSGNEPGDSGDAVPPDDGYGFDGIVDAADESDVGGSDASADGSIACPSMSLYGCNACSASSSCTRWVECQAGQQAFEYACVDGCWKFVPKACDPQKSFDSCPGTYLWCSDTLWKDTNALEPPIFCPAKLPTIGSACVSWVGGMISTCGYPCDPITKSGWTIATCSGPAATWLLDGACE